MGAAVCACLGIVCANIYKQNISVWIVSERRRYISDAFFHWRESCSSKDGNQWKYIYIPHVMLFLIDSAIDLSNLSYIALYRMIMQIDVI